MYIEKLIGDRKIAKAEFGSIAFARENYDTTVLSNLIKTYIERYENYINNLKGLREELPQLKKLQLEKQIKALQQQLKNEID